MVEGAVDMTVTISAGEFRKGWNGFSIRATRGETFIITRYGRPSFVFMSIEEFEKLHISQQQL